MRSVVVSVVVAAVLCAASSALGSNAAARRATGAPGWIVYGFNEKYKGRVVSISPGTHRVTDTLYVVPKNSWISGGGVWGMAGAAIDPEDGDVYTATGNSLGADEHAGYSERVGTGPDAPHRSPRGRRGWPRGRGREPRGPTR